MSTLKQELEKRGATSAQVNSKVVEMASDVIADGAVDEFAEVRQAAQRLTHEFSVQQGRVQDLAIKVDRLKMAQNALSHSETRAYELNSELQDTIKAGNAVAKKLTLTDPTLLQSVGMYSEVLSRTKSIVGEEMTEQIWLKTIEAASYGMWRAIMGPKFEEKAPRRI